MTRNQVEDVQRFGRQILVRLATTPSGSWLAYNSSIDALLDHLARELGVAGRGAKTVIIAGMGIDHSAISRCRHGLYNFQESWLLRAHELSGIPIEELRWVSCLSGEVARHKNARPSRPGAV